MAGQANPGEEHELDELLKAQDDLAQLYKILFEKHAIPSEEDMLETEQAYASHSVKMQLSGLFDEDEEKRESAQVLPFVPKKNYTPFIYAAMVVAGLSIGFIAFFYSRPDKINSRVQKNEITTRKGSKSRILLPDNTVVWLNADSKIIYPDNFQKEKREVQLTGEAFFEVTKDPRRPFIIHTNSIDIKVLGTVFNVRSYPEESTSETSLLKGEIEVTIHQSNKKLLLSPNQKLTVANYTTAPEFKQNKIAENKHTEEPLLTLNNIHYNEDSISTATSWIDNTLYFDNELLEKVVSKIERWYNVEIVIKNEKLRSAHFTAAFENETLVEVMEALSLSNPFKYKIEENKLSIY